jgi:regulator of protease activity HflC (stomatin/prohibitin superfamily)
VREAHAGLLYENGRFVRTLGPGRRALAAWPWRREDIICMDLRRATLALADQEMLTADGLTVRVTVLADYRVIDPERAVHGVTAFAEALYGALQLFLREEVQARTIDALLADRAGVATAMLERGRGNGAELGLELSGVGVRDLVLPADVKKLLAREAEALREGRAALVAAREEVAATRARANTARLLAEHPILVRLRELEALTEVADGRGNTVVLAVPPAQTELAAISALRGS